MVIATVSHTYIHVGTVDQLGSIGEGIRYGDFLTTHDGIAILCVGTHTGEVLIEYDIAEPGTVDAAGSADAHADMYANVELDVVGHQLLASTFWGLVQDFMVTIPEDWSRMRVTARSYRFYEARGRAVSSHPDPIEKVSLTFSQIS